MKQAALHLCRSLWAWIAVLAFAGGLGAQTTGDGEFYVDLAAHAVFPYDPDARTRMEEAAGLSSGPGVTAAFGYAFRQGFSTELEWGYHSVGVGDPDRNLLQGIDAPEGVSDLLDPGSLPFSIRIDGEIRNVSLMGNLAYRHPEWRLSPYGGFGAGVIFYDGTVDTTLGIDPGAFGAPLEEAPSVTTTLRYDDSRFAYQLMAGLSVRVGARVDLRAGYRFRSGRTGPFDADHVEGGIRFRF